MNEVFRFTVPGRAQPGGSKKAFPRGQHVAVVDANPKVGAWRERVALVAAEAFGGRELLDGPLFFGLQVYLLRPASYFTSKGTLNKKGVDTPYPIGRPDVLKLARAIEDALSGVVFVDDARIVRESLSKDWGVRDEVVIEISELKRNP